MADRLPLPDIIIGGAPRSGTTFLAEVLLKHPAIYLAQPIAPEPKVCLRDHPDDSGYFADYATFFSKAPEGSIRIEKTTNYFENSTARQRLMRLLPETRFLFILREPVARAYSNWKWSKKNGLETLSFAEAVALEGQRRNPFGNEREAARPFDYMIRGRYGSLAAEWYALFGTKRIRFFLFEDAMRDPESFVQELQDWIGVQKLPWHELRTGKVNATEDDASGLDPILAAKLRKEIKGEIDKFSALSGVDVCSWSFE